MFDRLQSNKIFLPIYPRELKIRSFDSVDGQIWVGEGVVGGFDFLGGDEFGVPSTALFPEEDTGKCRLKATESEGVW